MVESGIAPSTSWKMQYQLCLWIKTFLLPQGTFVPKEIFVLWFEVKLHLTSQLTTDYRPTRYFGLLRSNFNGIDRELLAELHLQTFLKYLKPLTLFWWGCFVYLFDILCARLVVRRQMIVHKYMTMVGRSGQNSSKVTRIKCNVYES